MKKITGERWTKQVRVSQSRERKRLRRLQALITNTASRKTSRAKRRTTKAARSLVPRQERFLVKLPDVLSLRSNYERTVEALHAMRRLVLVHQRPVLLDFTDVHEIEAAATLVLTAEIYRCNELVRYSGGRIVSGSYPADVEVHLQLREMGFYKLIGVPDRPEIKDERDGTARPRFLRFFTFDSVMAEAAAILTDLVSVGAFEMADMVKGRMTGALKEAMGNAVEHAYKETGNYPSMKGRWFCAAYVNPTEREMMIALFDQGVGIPITLGATTFERIIAILERGSLSPSDGNMISAATELYRTSTGQRGRGRGFRDMKKFVDSCDDGELRVLSNRGSYRYMKGDEKILDHRLSIEGTLVEWRVRHGRAVEFEDA